MEDRLRDISTLAAEQDRRRWRDLERAGLTLPELGGTSSLKSYLYDGVDVVARPVAPQGTRVAPQGTGVAPQDIGVAPGDNGEGVENEPRQDLLSVPLRVRGEVIGHLDLALGGRDPAPQEADMVEAVAERIGQALERAQLFQETQLRATRDQLAREAVENIRSAVTMEDAVRRAIREVGRTLGASEVMARVGLEGDLLSGRQQSSPEGDGHE
jgi:GAF domain-containing protein